jgi:hypothetical protein
MEAIAPMRKLKLNKKTISALNNHKISNHFTNDPDECKWTVTCTYPECASEPNCRTNVYQSCAPCVPPKGDVSKPC